MKEKIKHVFFDLDRTLWDFEKSAAQTFEELFISHQLFQKGVSSVKKFHEVYTIHNDRLWDQYRKGEIKKEILRGLRFSLTLKDFGITDKDFGERLGDDYVRLSPIKVNLFPYSIEILEYLYPKYKLHIITNGFSEVQEIKLKTSKIDSFFIEVITSEDAGYKKPDTRIFDYAFNKTGALPQNSIMIGDDYEVDIIGAKNVGMRQIFFDPYLRHIDNESTFYINNLKEIEEVL
ncbi:MAG: YjjG family noncanonical pyrimidine nucleotidase [Bacteroidota bacterium]